MPTKYRDSDIPAPLFPIGGSLSRHLGLVLCGVSYNEGGSFMPINTVALRLLLSLCTQNQERK